ncbi:hypothetical protein MANES_18G082300v8 [Manihot esculenta]|uniref:Uncharacterized protein n=1 Tax=Manihot esculenta TaxID=3983 RepID=A0ACB7G0D0_MANES|nr:hypothetical protein MANES_18G082300v8 [Manihot esculenta]
MEEGTSGGGGGETSSRITPSYVKLGDRQIFTVELRPGETTFVSWKKLMKDANKANSRSAPTLDPPPDNARINLESRLAPGQPVENEEEAPPPNRFSAVIEKIERLYMGKDSSDEEDLKDVPDDDQYDTDDSFIDDAELDEYFEVDNSAIKHDGFFVNRGKLERINEPIVVPNQQAKKRRRKDLTKASGESDDGRTSNKQVKLGKSAAGKIASPLGKNSSNPSPNLVVTSENYEDVRAQSLSYTSGISSKKKSAEIKMNLDPSSSIKISNGGSSDVSHQKYHDKSAYLQSKSQFAKSVTNVDELEPSVRSKEKNGVHELPDLNMPDAKMPMQVTKPSQVHKKDGSSVRPKGSMLENAIRDLEKMVAESRPPALENQEADTSAQAIKRRLPSEIKQKLAKVARLAASQGKVSKELLNRLMSILGHLIQLRTLKRNLKIMINMGLSAKQEKDDRFQQIKKEVAEMIKTCGPSSDSKALEQQAGAPDDFQEIASREKGALKRKFSMDAMLEDKICDLYDLFVDGLDEDAGPQVRKLYVELAQLWPRGFMDNHGIKRAICRAKERRRSLYSRHKVHKDQEKIKRKKMLAPRLDEIARVEAGSVAQQQYVRERLPTDTGGPVLGLASKPVPNSSTAALQASSPSMNMPNLDRLKQEKPKGSSSNPIDEAKMGVDGALTKKKVKRKSEQESDETHFLSEKLHCQSSEERNKSLRQASGLSQKLNLQLPASSLEQS